MEVQNMGFGWLQYVPEWAVNQDMMVALASSYSRDEKSLIVGIRKIPYRFNPLRGVLDYRTMGIVSKFQKHQQSTDFLTASQERHKQI
ncbi:uncharacterized protein DS421_13g404670 [Arachis hypogaea]|nr:uncharacterized protein DS421_13g404670 [Arachis hypogaea]